MDWKDISKKIGIGAGFGFLAYLLSGDGSSLAIGLLVIYLEFRFRR